MKKIKVLFCCMGNICRSPTAHGVFDLLVSEENLSHLIEVDSAGTHAYHVGNSPDPRSQDTALNRGVDLSHLRARQAVPEDFERFEYVIAMDQENYDNLSFIAPAGGHSRLFLMMDFARGFSRNVPDPYYGGDRGFEKVFDMIEKACKGLLKDIQEKHL